MGSPRLMESDKNKKVKVVSPLRLGIFNLFSKFLKVESRYTLLTPKNLISNIRMRKFDLFTPELLDGLKDNDYQMVLDGLEKAIHKIIKQKNGALLRELVVRSEKKSVREKALHALIRIRDTDTLSELLSKYKRKELGISQILYKLCKRTLKSQKPK